MKEGTIPKAIIHDDNSRLRAEVNQGKNVSLLFENRIDREWLTTIEAAHVLAISPNALRILVHRGQVRVYKFGRRLRFRLVDLQALFTRKGA